MIEQIRLITPHDTLIVGEVEGMRELSSAEKIHYRKATEEPCHLCNATNNHRPIVWVDSFEQWRNHKSRCNAVAFICRTA